MGTSGLTKLVENDEIDEDWISDLIDRIDEAYDDIDTLQADLAALEATVAGLVSEGDYSTYTLISTLTIPAGTSYAVFKPRFTNSDTELWYVDVSRNLIKLTALDSTPAIADTSINVERDIGSIQNFSGQSVYGKYLGFIDYTSSDQTIRVFKDGTAILTNTLTGSNYYANVSISHNGKYICAMFYDYSVSTYKWEVWEGS